MDVGTVLINAAIILLLLAAALFTLIGLPGNWVIFLLAAAYGYWQDFTAISATLLLILLALVLAGEAIEFVAGMWGANRQQASVPAMLAASLGGIAGGIIGTLFLPIIGSLLGAFGGAFGASYAVEYVMTGNKVQSANVARGVLVAQIAGMVVKSAIAVAMAVTVIRHLSW